MKKNFMHLMAIMVGIMTSACILSCDDKDRPEDMDETKTKKEFILGTWNFKNNYDERISITFFDNGTYAHCDYQDDYGYEGFYKLTSDLVVFTIADGNYNRSIKIIELSDDSFIFEGDDEGDVHGIIYNGVYKGTKERNIDEKTVVRYRKEIIGEWSITYDYVYGTQIATLDIKDNGTFLFYDEDGRYRYYKGTYSICDDKIMMFENTQKCPIGGYLYTIKELTDNSFVFVDKYNDEIIGSK